jgi:hypothetical protein
MTTLAKPDPLRLIGFLEDGLGRRITKQMPHRNYYLCRCWTVTPDSVTAELAWGDCRHHGYRAKFGMAGDAGRERCDLVVGTSGAAFAAQFNSDRIGNHVGRSLLPFGDLSACA